jgi:hypothetical protein
MKWTSMRTRRVQQAMRAMRLGLGAATNLTISAQVAAAAAQYGVDPALALAIAQQESGLNPNATSSAGAMGVMQLMPATAAAYGVTNAYDPAQNIPAGVAYLASLLTQYGGDQTKALAAYNAGPGTVNAAVAANGDNWLAAMPAETQAYVENISGVTPADAAQPALLTLDASTGLPVDDSTDASALPSVNGGLLSGMDTSTLLLIAGLAAGVWLLSDAL